MMKVKEWSYDPGTIEQTIMLTVVVPAKRN